MDKKQPEAIRIAEWLEGIRGNTWPSYIPQEAAAELRRQHAEIETLRAGYDAARLEIESLRERVQQLGQLARDVNSRRIVELEAQLAAVGAGGVEPLRKRECLHQISEPAQPVGWAIFAENGNGLMWTQSRQNAEVSAKNVGLQVTPLYAAPQSAAQALDVQVLMRVIQRLNQNPYSLTKSECISEIEAMRDAASAAQGGA